MATQIDLALGAFIPQTADELIKKVLHNLSNCKAVQYINFARPPTQDNLIVFYLSARQEWQSVVG